MRNIRFYISLIMIIGLFIGINSNSFAGERYNIDINNFKKAVIQNIWDGNADVTWEAKVRNNTDHPKTYLVKVEFFNRANEQMREASKTVTINPSDVKAVSYKLGISSSRIKDIDSGFITISDVEDLAENNQAHVFNAFLQRDIDIDIASISDYSVELSYSVKVRNNTDKAMTRNVTIEFFDKDNNHIKTEKKRTTFTAGEIKMISDKLVVSTSDAKKITKGHVIVN